MFCTLFGLFVRSLPKSVNTTSLSNYIAEIDNFALIPIGT